MLRISSYLGVMISTYPRIYGSCMEWGARVQLGVEQMLSNVSCLFVSGHGELFSQNPVCLNTVSMDWNMFFNLIYIMLHSPLSFSAKISKCPPWPACARLISSCRGPVRTTCCFITHILLLKCNNTLAALFTAAGDIYTVSTPSTVSRYLVLTHFYGSLFIYRHCWFSQRRKERETFYLSATLFHKSYCVL